MEDSIRHGYEEITRQGSFPAADDVYSRHHGKLELLLRNRFELQRSKLKEMKMILELPLERIDEWGNFLNKKWIAPVPCLNANHLRPLEGVLVTYRLSNSESERMVNLVKQLETDPLIR